MSKQKALQWSHEVYSIYSICIWCNIEPLFCLLLQSNHLARGPKLPNCALLSVSEGPRGDAQLESIAGERSGESLVTLLEHNVCACLCV